MSELKQEELISKALDFIKCGIAANYSSYFEEKMDQVYFPFRKLLEGIIKSREESQSALDDLSKRFTALIQQNSALAADNERLTEELIRACAELSGIKKQEPAAYCVFSETGNIRIWWSNDGGTREHSAKAWAEANGYPLTSLYAKPVHQHSFTLSGIGTFYADSELEITYLERLHGVGGKANLKAVDEEHF